MANRWVCVVALMTATTGVLSKSSLFCENSTIDAITFANDFQMYWLSSGGHFWWLKENQFPPDDDKAQTFASPFTKANAVVYVDSQSGCAQPATDGGGMVANERHIWVMQYIEGRHKMMPWDVVSGKWVTEKLIEYNSDHCSARADINWAEKKPIDAMFASNYLWIYYVKGNTIAMVDCHFMCKGAEGWGEEKPPQSVELMLLTKPKIHGVFIKKDLGGKDKTLYVFTLKTFSTFSVDKFAANGDIQGLKKEGPTKDIFKDFLNITKPEKCAAKPSEAQPPKDTPAGDGPPPAPQEDATPATDATKKDESKESGGNAMIYIILVVVVVIIVVIAVAAYILCKGKSEEGGKAGAAGGAPPAKAGPSGAKPNPKK